MFEKLKEQTGHDNIDDMVKTFLTYEEENYVLFKQTSALNDEVIIIIVYILFKSNFCG